MRRRLSLLTALNTVDRPVVLLFLFALVAGASTAYGWSR